MIKIIMHGCNGKMGRVICDIAREDTNAEIVAGVDIISSNAIFPTFVNVNDCDMDADVIIDFSTAKAVPSILEYAVNKKLPIVICTTGLDDSYISLIDEAGFDVEIVERHHNQKIDAPSGTAILLADAVNESVDNKLEYVYDRSKVREKRDRKELGMHAVRGGTIVGDHEVIFAGKDEVIEFTHSAHSKEVFAVGAVKAAKYLVGKNAGRYDMQDIMSEI